MRRHVSRRRRRSWTPLPLSQQSWGSTIERSKKTDVVIQPSDLARGRVWFATDGERMTVGFRRTGGQDELFGEPNVEFDPASGLFVGKTTDAFIVPTSGEPHLRRSAVAVVAEMLLAAASKL